MKRLTGHFAIVVKKRIALAFVMAFLGLVGAARAVMIEDLSLVGWYGDPNGANQAALVVDFGAGNGASDSFAFGVKFDSAPTAPFTGFQLLQAVQSGNPNFGFDATIDPTYGAFVDEIAYFDANTQKSYDVTPDWSVDGTWWNYYTSDNGDPLAMDWDSGASSRYLLNGSIDAWVASDGTNPPVAPLKTPEPSTLALIVTGGLALLAWFWRRKGFLSVDRGWYNR